MPTPRETILAALHARLLALPATAHAVYLPRPRIEIKGPKGVQASFDWQAALATSPARMCTVVLINNLAGYPWSGSIFPLSRNGWTLATACGCCFCR